MFNNNPSKDINKKLIIYFKIILFKSNNNKIYLMRNLKNQIYIMINSKQIFLKSKIKIHYLNKTKTYCFKNLIF